MPQRLLDILTDTPRAGTDLGAQLGLRRSSIHALAGQLQASGVPVQVSRAGYALAAGTPAPALVQVRGRLGQALRYVAHTGSTQDELRAWARAEAGAAAPHGAVVVAETQTAARGRRGQAWQTGAGNLAFSVLLRGPIGAGSSERAEGAEGGGWPLASLPPLPLLAGVALRRAVGGGWLKWPNDLLDGEGRKLAGLLLEADLRGEVARHVVLGVGINVAEAPAGAACVTQYRPQVTRAQLLADFLAELEAVLAQPAAEGLAEWRAHSATLGAQVRVENLGGTEGPVLEGAVVEGSGARGAIVEGKAENIDAAGSLLVRLPSGQLHTVSAGDVQLVGKWRD